MWEDYFLYFRDIEKIKGAPTNPKFVRYISFSHGIISGI